MATTAISQKPLFTIHQAGSIILIRFTEFAKWIDVASANQADKDLTALIEDNQGTTVVLNLTPIEMMATLMIGHLVRLHKTLERGGGRLKLCDVGQSVVKTLAIMGLDKQLEIAEDETTALEEFGETPPPIGPQPAQSQPSDTEEIKEQQEGLDTDIMSNKALKDPAERESTFDDPRDRREAQDEGIADLPLIWDEPDEGSISFVLDQRKLLATDLVERIFQHLKKIAFTGKYKQMVLDFEQVYFLSSRLVGYMTKLQKVMGEHSGTLTLTNIHSDLRPLFRILKVDQIVEILEAGTD
ncbi:MAG: STAS domain-containing protein [Planctomycetota bacterium]|jgi:anti-anti-sigma factor|nr:STAS domain-containing protein [Planctomycetota bacterium]MDP7131018.1 STAS domain-containing protein [Planctomycetota bacterium]